MTLALDHTPAATVTPRVARLLRAIRARLAAFHRHWFVAYEASSDPLASLNSRELWDLPVSHPAQPED